MMPGNRYPTYNASLFTSVEMQVTAAIFAELDLTVQETRGMDCSSEISPQSLALLALARAGAERLGCSIELHELLGAGYVLGVSSERFDSSLALHLSDFDDTSVATTQAKTMVLEGYKSLLNEKMGLTLKEETVQAITDAADVFAVA
ncbi:hypothetical protein IPL68_04135 [Candidatus Saccharibacteria bacterium]|nr:MAG: hypothetical protein IPL68_04135 [Candidatus Saccharibacteria bacterium]